MEASKLGNFFFISFSHQIRWMCLNNDGTCFMLLTVEKGYHTYSLFFILSSSSSVSHFHLSIEWSSLQLWVRLSTSHSLFLSTSSLLLSTSHITLSLSSSIPSLSLSYLGSLSFELCNSRRLFFQFDVVVSWNVSLRERWVTYFLNIIMLMISFNMFLFILLFLLYSSHSSLSDKHRPWELWIHTLFSNRVFFSHGHWCIVCVLWVSVWCANVIILSACRCFKNFQIMNYRALSCRIHFSYVKRIPKNILILSQ